MGRGGKASMLHVYVSYVPESLPATLPPTGARYSRRACYACVLARLLCMCPHPTAALPLLQH
jgi:hypothetical protein